MFRGVVDGSRGKNCGLWPVSRGAGRDLGRALGGLCRGALMTARLAMMGKACALQMDVGLVQMSAQLLSSYLTLGKLDVENESRVGAGWWWWCLLQDHHKD